MRLNIVYWTLRLAALAALIYGLWGTDLASKRILIYWVFPILFIASIILRIIGRQRRLRGDRD